MADELFQGSLSGYNTWSSMRFNDLFSCSAAAANVGEASGSFECFPATTAGSFECFPDRFPTPDLLPCSVDWSQSFPFSDESGESNNFYADYLHERPTAEQYCTQEQMELEDISQGLFLLEDQSYNLPSPLEFSSNEILGWNTTATTGTMPICAISSNANPTEMANWAAVGDSMLPIRKKLRVEAPSPLPSFKVRKEKLGDRITALQQLVSPFGKTDTASVLHEAIDYIKFLHEELTGLSNPYSRDAHQRKANQQNILGRQNNKEEEETIQKDLRSRGLCLVPISSTFEMAGDEIPPFDFWTQLWRKL